MKCATIENGSVRTPEQSEIDNCQYIITKEIGIIDPKLIVVFGNQPMAAFTDMQFGVTDLTGEVIHNDHLDKDIFIMMHPAAVARNKTKNYPVYKDGIRKLKEYVLDNQLNAKFLVNWGNSMQTILKIEKKRKEERGNADKLLKKKVNKFCS